MRNKKGFIIILMVVMSSIALNIVVNNTKDTSNQEDDIQNIANDTPEKADDFVPDPPGLHSGKYWNFTTGDIVGWRETSGRGSRDSIFNITDLKLFQEAENVTGDDEQFYGVSLTPSYWNVTENKIMEFTNRTLFPIANVSLLNFTMNMMWPSWMDAPGRNIMLNLFIPKNSSDVLDIHYCANSLLFVYSYMIGGGAPPPYADLSVTPNSIHYSRPDLETYCNLYYYDNGTLRTGEMRVLFDGDTSTFNWTRIFDINPLDDLKWSENFDTPGDELFVGMNTNETRLVFNHTVDNMELEIEWDDDDEEWEIDLWYYQEIWANMSYWHYEYKNWVYINCTPVASANEIYPIIFGGDDDDDDDDTLLPPMILIPNQSTYFSLGDVFKIFEFNPKGSDLRVESGDNWVKLTNTTTSKIVVFSYQIDGILEYIYMQDVGPFGGMDDNGHDEDIMFYYKNLTSLQEIKPNINSFSLHTFDLGSLSASINISVEQMSGLFHSGFPYNPTNQSISNALGFFDIFMQHETDLDQTYFAPINITFYYDHTTYKSVKVFWFNMSADNHKGAWEEIPIKNFGNGVIVITLNHTSIIVFTASKIVSLPSDDGDDDDDEKEAAIPFGNFYLLFIAIGIIGLIIYDRRKYLTNKF